MCGLWIGWCASARRTCERQLLPLGEAGTVLGGTSPPGTAGPQGIRTAKIKDMVNRLQIHFMKASCTGAVRMLIYLLP